MYLPRAFAQTDLAALDSLVDRNPFATVISFGGDEPVAGHVPVLYARDGDAVRFEGHFARPNLQSRMPGPALLIVHGPSAYVSPSWYPDKEDAARVPTWNYTMAHVHGEIELVPDEDWLADHVGRLSAHFEARVGEAWVFEAERPDHRSQLRGIVGFRFVATRVEVKEKLSQNHPDANIRSVAAHLAAQARPESNEIAVRMAAALASKA